jgi:thioredoxin 1
MSKQTITNLVIVFAVVVVVVATACIRERRLPAESTDLGIPRLVELGAGKCEACKKMAPIIEELRTEYAGRVAVESIDVLKEPARAGEFDYGLIPTQVLLDKDGREVWRHEGFIPKTDLQSLLAEKVGVE